MPKLPQVSGLQLVKAFARIGFEKISQRGSHIKLRRVKSDMVETVIIPDHKRVKPGTLRNGILKPIGVSVEELVRLLRK